jgi:predicted dehydrogenase
MSSLLNIAFIGAGNMSNEHARAFAEIPGVRLAGICSRTRERSVSLAAKYLIPEVCDSIADLYERTKAQIVVISVPELFVRDVCLEAFRFPWICLIEKPAGYDLADAEAIAAAARQHDRKAFVAFNRRHYSSTRKVLDDLSRVDGERFVHVCDQEDPRAALASGQPELVTRNWMYANSIHLIDYFRILGRGEIVNVDPVFHWTPENPKFVAAKIRYASGDIGLYQCVWNGPGPWSVTVTTQQKRWEMRPLEQAAFQVYGSRVLEKVEVDEIDTKFKPGLRFQAGELIKAALREPHSLPSLEDSLESMRLVKAIYREGR